MMRTLGLMALSLALGCGAPATQSGAPAPEKTGAQPDAPKPTETASAATSTLTSVGTSTSAAQSTEAAPAYHSMLVDDAEALPECVKEAEGWLVYVKAAEKFMACVSGQWAAVEIKGDDGAPGLAGAKGDKGDKGVAGEEGAAGANGSDGAPGADGTDNRVVYSLNCDVALNNSVLKAGINGSEVLDLNITPIDFSIVSIFWRVDLFASDDLLVSASLGDGQEMIGGSEYYSSSQTGAATGGIVLVRDYAWALDGGYFAIERAGTNLLVQYSDIAPDNNYANFGSNSRTVQWTFPIASVCTEIDF